MTTRRIFLKQTSIIIAANALPIFAFPKFRKEKLGVALVGLGYYSRDLLAPALQLTQNCELKGIVTGSPEKIPVWQRKYGIADKNIYNYENMHKMENNDEIDVVYIVLPNSLHKKFTLIGAEAGKHIWCEKPMATNVKDCQAMIEACNKNKVQLTIGYRMQHEPVTQRITEWSKTKPYGEMISAEIEAGFIFGGQNPDHWKLHKELGGGAMFDMGVYPLNAARYVTGLEPLSVEATIENSRPDLIKVDETVKFKLAFPNNILVRGKATFAEYINELKVNCSDGWYRLKPFQAYSGVSGTTSDNQILQAFKGNQQAKQMDDDARAILQKTAPLVPGEEGLQDIRVVEAIFKSAAQNGKNVPIN